MRSASTWRGNALAAAEERADNESSGAAVSRSVHGPHLARAAERMARASEAEREKYMAHPRGDTSQNLRTCLLTCEETRRRIAGGVSLTREPYRSPQERF